MKRILLILTFLALTFSGYGQQIHTYPAVTLPAASDLFVMDVNVAGTFRTRKFTLSDLRTNIWNTNITSSAITLDLSLATVTLPPFVAPYTSFPIEWCIALSDETTSITTGTAKVTMRAPYAFTITAVRASVNTVSSSGLPTVNIKESGTTIFSTNLSIDASEFTSVTAATPAVISDTAIADDAEITFDITVAGTGAKGLKVWILGHR